MKRKSLLMLSGAFLATCTLAQNNNIQQQPNIVLFLVDDMGYRDLACYGSKLYETPNIDQLRRNGVKFTQAYVPVSICSPTRASLLTGKHCADMYMWNHTDYVPKEEKLLPQYLKEVGYQSWHVGKWHMGNKKDKTFPEYKGFDVNIAGHVSWGPGSYFWPYGSNEDGSAAWAFDKKGNPKKDNKGNPRKYWERNRVPGLYKGGKKGEYLTDRLTTEAVKLIDKRDKNKPFFLNLWHYGVHDYKEAKPELIKKYEDKIKLMGLTPTYFTDPVLKVKLLTSETNPVYAAMIESIDDSVGRVIQRLKEIGEYDKTLFVFMSDNGPTTKDVPCVPMRGGKNSNYEAGVRVPAIIAWSGHIKPNSTYNKVIKSEDFFDTAVEVAGVDKNILPKGSGESLITIFNGKELPNRTRWWFFPRDQHIYGHRGGAAAFDEATGLKYIMFFNGDQPELYDINSDLAESKNIINQYPAKAKELRDMIRINLSKVYAKMNPYRKYDKAVKKFLAEK